MRYERQEIILLVKHFRLGPQRARNHGNACGQRQEEERSLPRVLVDTPAFFRLKRTIDLRRENGPSLVDDDAWQYRVHTFRTHARVQQRLRGVDLLRIEASRGLSP